MTKLVLYMQLFCWYTPRVMAFVSFAVIILLLVGHSQQVEKCLTGPFHLNYSAPGGPNFVECLTYKDDTCCTDDLTKTLKHRPETLYNFTWHHCQTVSKPCLHYLVNEECFYQCEPKLIRYQRINASYAVENVPICADYCNSWFDACKDDQTCVENWESGFVKDGHHYLCPNASSCSTFASVYKNGAGLCNKMWGKSFTYHSSTANCYTMGPKHTSKGASDVHPQMKTAIAFILTVFAYLESS